MKGNISHQAQLNTFSIGEDFQVWIATSIIIVRIVNDIAFLFVEARAGIWVIRYLLNIIFLSDYSITGISADYS